MSILTKIFSGGATELVKGVGDVIDNLHTSKEEKLAAELKVKELVSNYETQMEKEILQTHQKFEFLSNHVFLKLNL